MAQLELDTYELGKWGVQGLSKNEMHMDQQMATSLHSCANHLIACPCGCRKHPMNDGRLQRDGMHGLLVSMNMMIKAHDIIYPKMRHIHPDELSLFNGVRPGQNWGANLRLALCGLGQLASPLQSGWIASTIKAHLYAINLVQEQPSTPIQNMQKMMQDLLGDRDKVFGPQQHPQAVAFAEAVSKMTHPIVNPPDDIQQVPSQFPEMNPKESAKEESFAKLSQESLDDLGQAILAVGAEVRQKDTQAFATGAVPGFAVKRKNVEDGDTTIKRQCVDPSVVAPQTHPFQTDTKVDTSGNGMEAVKEGGPCPSDRWCPNSGSVEVSKTDAENSETSEIPPIVQDGYEIAPTSPDEDTTPGFEVVQAYVVTGEGALSTIVAPNGTLVEQVIQAEKTLLRRDQDHVVMDAMGTPVSIHTKVQQGQVLLLEDEVDIDRSGNPPRLAREKRDVLLWKQKAWVAMDEMTYYLRQLGNGNDISFQNPVQIPSDPTWEAFTCNHLLKMVASTAEQHGGVCISAGLKDNHWIPFVVQTKDDIIKVSTSPTLCTRLQTWCQEELQADIVFVSMQFEQKFQADCGFQAISWIASIIQGFDHHQPMDNQAATEMRCSFHRHIESCQQAEVFVEAPLKLGGMTKDGSALQKLLQDHGVHPQRCQECAEHVTKALGPQVIHQIMLSPRPWADLKSRASMQQPPIRLVLAEELQNMIQNRIKQGGPVGRKNNKVKTTPQEAQMRFKLLADQVSVPKAVFMQSDGVELQQIMPKDLQPGCKGIVVANIEDALPFFGLKSPVSSEGVRFAYPRLHR